MSAGRFILILLVGSVTQARSANCVGSLPDATAQPQFFDQPSFIVAGVTDNTYRGGHGSDTPLRASEALSNATVSLGNSPATAAAPNQALTQADEQSGDPLRAVQQLQRAAELNPTEPNIFEWGTELLAHRAPEPAAEVFTKGARLFPQSIRMLLGLASARYAAGSYARAADCFFEASDLAPKDPTPYLFLGKVQAREILESAGYEERIARFAKLEPANALASYYYAVTIWNRRRGAEDLEAQKKTCALLQKAIALDPHLGPAYLQLGILYAEQHKYREAIHTYLQAINASPSLEEAHYRLSEAYRATGDRTKATQEVEAYNRISKESADKVERERREVQQFVIALRSQTPQ
ncbi:MAG TPA: tetratricopeptide repeat protein [Bryobacteraceae bacterium]|nr:tetratricopeptide repeat protein [Bryobacteraceae bacterium]